MQLLHLKMMKHLNGICKVYSILLLKNGETFSVIFQNVICVQDNIPYCIWNFSLEIITDYNEFYPLNINKKYKCIF